MNKKNLQVLDVGSGATGTASSVFKEIFEAGEYEYNIVRLDINPNDNPDVVHDIRKPFPTELLGKFDLVLASHVLEHVERQLAGQAFNNIVSALAHMGELWVVVPSIEWCAEEIMKGETHAGIWQCIFGGGEPDMPSTWYHHMGYSLLLLREMFRRERLVVRKAYQAPLILPFHDKRSEKDYTMQAVQNIVIGVRVEPPVDIVG